MQGLVTVFGGSGFVGRQVVRALAKAGWRIRVAVRQPHLAQDLRLAGDVGQIQLMQANVRNPASVARALDGAWACVNAVGQAYEQGRQTFTGVHLDGARAVAEAARAQGVARFIQMSGVGASPQAASKYVRARGLGEAAVREAIPQATILRPSVAFGPQDNFFNRFARMAALSPVLPVIAGPTRLQPVYVGDIALALAHALADEATRGETFELAGPGVYTVRELMQLVCDETLRRPLLLPVPGPVAGLIGLAGDLMALAVAPPLTSDQLVMLADDNLADPALPGLAALGVTPTAVEAVIGDYLYRYRRGGQYAETPARALAVS